MNAANTSHIDIMELALSSPATLSSAATTSPHLLESGTAISTLPIHANSTYPEVDPGCIGHMDGDKDMAIDSRMVIVLGVACGAGLLLMMLGR